MHDLIVEELENLKDYIFLESENDEKCIDDIISLVKEAKVKGQTMEDRLYVYRQAIEGLGFKRDRSKERDNIG